eukprot:COSAG01_NODE_229_length_21089_cov_575.019194_7_plen_115_part_00
MSHVCAAHDAGIKHTRDTVRVEMMGSHKIRNVGKYQPVLVHGLGGDDGFAQTQKRRGISASSRSEPPHYFQAEVRGLGVYTSVEVFNSIVDLHFPQVPATLLLSTIDETIIFTD